MPGEQPWNELRIDFEALTPREREVLTLMAEGWSNAAIAEQLVVQEQAVEKHSSNIFWKLGLLAEKRTRVNRRVAAVLIYLGLNGNSER